jgi:hypothetical protein
MKCRGFNCENRKLIEAHIIPKGFGRLIRGEGPNVKIQASGVAQANPQLGDYDPSILCADCDNALGLDDEYALKVCREFDTKIGDQRELFEINDVDCQRFARFILAVLWRASISKRKTFSSVSLGPYENAARDIVFGRRPLSDLRAFEVFVSRFKSDHFDPSGAYYYPTRFKFDGLNTYTMCLAGFRVLAKLDNRSFGPEFAPFIVNRTNVFRGVFLTFERCPEFKELANIVRAHA